MLYPNGQRIFAYPGRHVSGLLAASGAMAYGGLRGARLNPNVSQAYSEVLGAVPSGYGAKAYIFSVKSGGLTAVANLSITSEATGGMGMPSGGSASLTFTVADALAELLASGEGYASLSTTAADSVLTASLNASGSAEISITTSVPQLQATADGIGSTTFTLSIANAQAFPINDASPLRIGNAAMSITGVLTSHALGNMVGATDTVSALTTDSIAQAVWANVTRTITSSATTPTTAEIVEAVLVALTATTIPVNAVKMNGAAIYGDGSSGNLWRGG